MKKYIFCLYLISFGSISFGQNLYLTNGPAQNIPSLHAFVHADIFVNSNKKLLNATLLIENGRIKAVGNGLQIPQGAFVHDLKGQTIYPAFIDLYADYGLEPLKPLPARSPAQDNSETARKGAYYHNQAIKPETHAAQSFFANPITAETYRSQGFGAVLAQHFDGIVRGSAALVSLETRQPAREAIINEKAAMAFSFAKGSSSQDYPFSLVGSIALIRQFFLDAQFYAENSKNLELNLSLQAYTLLAGLPIIFEASSPESVLRAARICKEFGKKCIIKASGSEYQQIDEIGLSGASLIVPLDFPDAYQADNPATTGLIGYTQMLHWQHAPTNPARLAAAGIRFAFTMQGLKDKKMFLPYLRKAVRYGLSREQALAALTSIPAGFVNAQNQIGSLRAGLRASFVISSGDIFEDSAKLLVNWVDGQAYPIQDAPIQIAKGKYKISISGYPNLVFQYCGAGAGTLKMGNDTTELPLAFGFENGQIKLNFAMSRKPSAGWFGLTCRLENQNWQGSGTDSLGKTFGWKAVFEPFACPIIPKKEIAKPPVLTGLPTPFSPYGFLPNNMPKAAKNMIIRGATVWTCGPSGRLDTADVWVQDGKIKAVGKKLTVPASVSTSAQVILANGLHLTPGIVDEHSHIALSGGVNEGSHSVVSQVRMGDVLNASDINIYRHLAGGVTTVQLLHGSANSIGGQSALIKMRWGQPTQDLKIKNAPGFIKFALGENVKQSNWGNEKRSRYPQTRMGVEQTFVDAFWRAKQYRERWETWAKKPKSTAQPHRDLQLEALVEILEGKRHISCHSYVQSEINMLLHVADSLGFKINTFTHILEGYKVAEKMQKHGAAGSTFADWWAYKMEVLDAIPYNAALMSSAGVLVGINSDNAEMARRLNQEAAKTMKYGGLSAEQALHLITIHPAKMLHLDKQIGSIEVGKEADLVLWNGMPLSIYSKPLRTWVEGVCLFDIQQDSIQKAYINQNRQIIIGQMQEAQKAGLPTRPPVPVPAHLWHCEDVEYRYWGQE